MRHMNMIALCTIINEPLKQMPLTRAQSPPIRRLPCNPILLVTAYITIFYAASSNLLYQAPLQNELHYLHSIHLVKQGARTGLANEAAVPFTDEACAGLDHCIALHEACHSLEYCITIHVFAHRRAEATRQLLEALTSANYTSYIKISLPLIIHVDRPKETQDRGLTDVKEEEDKWLEYSRVRDLVQGFANWPHGPVIRNIQPGHKGLRQSWLEAWPNPRPNDIMVAFEDDTLPSPLYFVWLLKVVREYDLWDATKRDNRLLGISLSPVRFDEISIPIRQWMAYKEFPPAKYPLYLHALPSSWGAVYFGNQWRDFLDFVQLRGHPPFYDVKDEENLNFDSPYYAWGTRFGDPNLWLPKGSTISGWAKSWKRFMVDFAYGRGAYMLYPNLPNATGLATSLFLSGEHIVASAVKNPRQAPLLEVSEEMLVRLSIPFPAFRSLPLMDLHCKQIDRVVHAQHGDAFVNRIACLGAPYEALAHTWRRPCVLRRLDQAPTHSNSFKTGYSGPRRQYLFLLPSAIEITEGMMASNIKGQKDTADILARQLIAIAEAAIWSNQLGRTLILPHLTVGRTKNGKNDLQRIKNDWIPFSTLFYPNDRLLHTVLPDLDYIFADLEHVRAWNSPSHIALIEERTAEVVHNGSVTKLDEGYLKALGWRDVPQLSITFGDRGTEGNVEEDGLYAALGGCTDDILALGMGTRNNVYGVATEPAQRRLLSSVWKALFHPARVVEHMAHSVKAQMKYHYHCLRIPLEREINITSLHTPNLLVVSPSLPVEGNQTLNFGGKRIFGKPDIDGVVDNQLLITHPHATSAMQRVVASLVEIITCTEADEVLWTKEDLSPSTGTDFIINYYRKEENQAIVQIML